MARMTAPNTTETTAAQARAAETGAAQVYSPEVDAPQSVDALRSARTRSSKKQWLVKGLLLFAALIACGLPVLLIASPISYVPLITVVLLVLCSFAYVHVLKRTFSFSEEQIQQVCERGTNAALKVTLTNKSIFPHSYVDVRFSISDLFGGTAAVKNITVSLGPRQTNSFEFDAQFSHVGRYTAGVDCVVLHDFLGLFSAKIVQPICHQVLVRPRLFDFPDVTMEESSDSVTQLMKVINSTDSVDYSGVREYRFGDPMKTVHWNLSARAADRSLFTRLFEEFVSPSLSIIMDCFSDFKGNEELMCVFDGIVESSSSFARFARCQGVDCVVRYLNRSWEGVSVNLGTEADTEQLVLSAQRIAPLVENPQHAALPLEMLVQEGARARGSANVAFVTARLSEEMLVVLSELASRHTLPILVLCLPASFAGKERKAYLKPLAALQGLGIPYFVMESSGFETKGVAL